jgi:hypothetical protein
VTGESNLATLLFYKAFIQKELHQPAQSVAEVHHRILLILMQVPKLFHNLLVQVCKRIHLHLKCWVVPFNCHKHSPSKTCINTAVIYIPLVLGRWNTFGTHIDNIEEFLLLLLVASRQTSKIDSRSGASSESVSASSCSSMTDI